MEEREWASLAGKQVHTRVKFLFFGAHIPYENESRFGNKGRSDEITCEVERNQRRALICKDLTFGLRAPFVPIATTLFTMKILQAFFLAVQCCTLALTASLPVSSLGTLPALTFASDTGSNKTLPSFNLTLPGSR